MTGGEIIGAIIVFFLICAALEWLLKQIAAVLQFAVANFISTVLLVGGVIMGIGLLAGEASAAVAIAVPAATTVAKMRLTTGF